MRFNIFLAILLLFTVNASAQKVTKEQFLEIQKKLPIEKDRTKKANLFYKAAKYYIEKDGEAKKDLDSASLLNNWSINISKQFNLKENIGQSMLLNGEIARERGNSQHSLQLKTSALNYTLANDLKKECAAAYISIALDMPANQTLKKVEYFLKAQSLYKQAGLFYKEAETYTELAILYNNLDEPAISIKYANEAVKIKRRIKQYNLYKEFAMLALNLRTQGNYKDALAYALASEKNAENMAFDDEWLSLIYDLLGTIYSELKFESKSVEYYKKAIVVAKKMDDTGAVTSITLNTARSLYSEQKYYEALEILNSASKYIDNQDCNVGYDALYILIYCDLKKYDKARPYYEQLLRCDDGSKNHIAQEIMYYAMIRYLLKTKQAGQTYAYIDKLKNLATKNNDLFNLSQLEKAHFEADSASGNYMGAIEHFKKHKILNDSLYNVNKAKQYGDLQLKYETEKKDKNIMLLTQQGKLQEEKIRNAAILRNVFISGLVILVLFVVLLYNRSRLKQLTNKKLELKQQKINDQNDQLKKLLTEKEWLLKEIHHRVKNNLQIVISLLNTQSAYLDNEDALMAIQNSEHRMHAMSLIHQKLYQSDDLESIDMSWYIYELVNYLKECFTMDIKIDYKLDNECVKLDVTQAVPMGLILNEAISNAIKYAFKDRNHGQISISLKNLEADVYRLKIADNGVGLPEGFEAKERESLGMDLMMGLTDQLDGTFKLENTNGLAIIITFTKKRQLIH
ncbi:hypothetical protein FMM05_01075 [Flavobacterium zepuense]|uniref:histidine kinase n=1 Tax=Flavobacterium zepuense TaxID=2593302 RepID=A0A552VA72_9FLAO|nr:histidine kinase dimerization/phosphoacceptor domain -containing protein [Flavobacterium zepuense]TRW27260.1 hypothetical protein FMM05_01075 [Flavobacterium zepuense]